MEPDIIVISPDVEIHPSKNGGCWCVVTVSTGRVHSTHADLDVARTEAEGWAAQFEENSDAE